MALNINGTTGISGVDGSASAPALQGTDSNTGVSFGTDTVNINTGGTTRATVDSSGKLGIGTTSPSAILHCSSSSNTGIFAQSTNNGSSASTNYQTPNRIFYTGIDIGGTNSSYTIYDGTASAERMKIDTFGRIILGSPTVNTSIASSLVTTGRIQTDATYSLTSNGGHPVRILSTGLLVRESSSSRYKKDIANATWGLTDVLKLRPVTFKSNATGENADDKTYAGFVAEDVHDIGLTNFVEYNDSNQPDAIHYGHMVALLTKAIQELNTKVTTLETKVAALEAA